MRSAWILVAALSCGEGLEGQTRRVLLHRAEPGDSLSGPLASEYAHRLDLKVVPDGTLWVGPEGEAPAPPSAWVRIPGASAGVAVYRRRDGLPAPAVAIQALGGEPLDHPWIREARQHGHARPGGALVAELAVVVPSRAPVDVCLLARIDAEKDGEKKSWELNFGVLYDGRAPHHPGAGDGPLTRARLFSALPDDLPAGVVPIALRLVSCLTGSDLVAPAAWTVHLDGWGWPSDDTLRASSGEPDPAARWPERPPPRAGLHRRPDGTMEAREGPPLPRVERGEAWGLVLTPPLDPSAWGTPLTAAGPGPIAALEPLFGEADRAVLGLDAPASRAGVRQPVAAPPARRVSPEILDWLGESKVDAVFFGPRASDAGVDGLTGSVLEARSRGLQAGDPLVVAVGDGERALSVALLQVSADLLERRAAEIRQKAPGVLIFAQVVGEPGLELARRIARVADAGWILGDGEGAVVVLDGVPVWIGVPPVGAADREALAARWYVSPEGVRRLDVVPIISRGGRWERDTEGTLRPRLSQLQEASRPFGTDVVVGRTIAAVDVAAHGPDAKVGPFRVVPWEDPGVSPDVTRCPDAPEARLPGTSLGGRISLESAGRAADRLRLVWRVDQPPGAWEVVLSSPDGSWKARHHPCDAAWPTAEWPVGTRALDVVDLRVLGPAPPPGPLLLQVKEGGQPLLTADGGRWITVPPM